MTNSSNGVAPVVSVIIPTRDCLSYLPAAVRSVVAQGVEDFEIIIVDDGSRDGTWSWVLAHSAIDPRIKGIRLDGVGVSAARNIAISQARGELIAFLDADDLWCRGKLAQQIAFHNANPQILLSFTDYQHIDVNGCDLGACFGYWPMFRRMARGRGPGFVMLRHGLPHLFAENVVGTSSVVARRDALQCVRGFDEGLQSASDWDLWLKLASCGPVAYSPETLMTYLVRPGSISRKALLRLEAIGNIIERYRRRVESESHDAVSAAVARLEVAYGEHYRAEGRYLVALRHDVKALRLAPSRRAMRAAIHDLWLGAKGAFMRQASAPA